MKLAAITLLFTSAILFHASAEDLRSTSVAMLIEAALPGYSVVAGNRNWSGGFTSNASGPTIDYNTSFTIVRHNSEQALPLKKLTDALRNHITSTFNLPTAKPSSSWNKTIPDGVAEDSFSENIIVSRYPSNSELDPTMLISIQALRVNSSDVGITLSYTTVAK